MELEAFGLRVGLCPVPVISPIIPNVRRLMNTTAYFINASCQELAVEYFRKNSIPHRVKADRTLQFAKKWSSEFRDFATELSLEIFKYPAFCKEFMPSEYKKIIVSLAEHNIPWYAYVINEEYNFFYSQQDEQLVFEITEPFFPPLI